MSHFHFWHVTTQLRSNEQGKPHSELECHFLVNFSSGEVNVCRTSLMSCFVYSKVIFLSVCPICKGKTYSEPITTL